MKRTFRIPLLRHGLWLGTVLLPLTAQAAPAPLFDAILPDIQRQLPGDLQMRLPSYLPALPEPLYPSVDVDDTGLMVYLSPDPD